ncbi:hypothetical protein C9I50_18510 [Pseudomonas prosekii]|nr:hypothetical protein C9I50_18510 [Pseudomonas prosekii]
MLFKPAFGVISQVDVTRKNTSASLLAPLGRGEKVPTFMLFKPAFGVISQVGVTRKNTSVSPLAPLGRGGKGADLHAFQTCVRCDISGRCHSKEQLGQSPRPFGERVRVRGKFP